MPYFMSVRDQPVGDQHAMAAKVYALGTHVGSARTLGQRNQLGHCLLELRRKHVIRIVPKAGIAECKMRGVFTNFLPIASQSFHPDVSDSGGRQTVFEGFSIKLRQPPRHRKSANIHESLNLVSVKRLDKVVERASRMSDSVERSHHRFDANRSRNDATKGGDDRSILFGKHGPQIEQHTAFLDSRNDRRLRTTQPRR